MRVDNGAATSADIRLEEDELSTFGEDSLGTRRQARHATRRADAATADGSRTSGVGGHLSRLNPASRVAARCRRSRLSAVPIAVRTVRGALPSIGSAATWSPVSLW